MIYTDGSCSTSSRVGGYGAVILSDSSRKEIFGGYLKTTNNRMELMAIIHALACLPMPMDVTVITDSKYVVDAVRKGKLENWTKETGRKKANSDLWAKLAKACHKHSSVKFEWVKGHSNSIENERADQLAKNGLESKLKKLDRRSALNVRNRETMRCL